MEERTYFREIMSDFDVYIFVRLTINISCAAGMISFHDVMK